MPASPPREGAGRAGARSEELPAGWRESDVLRELRRRERSLRSRLLSVEADAARALALYEALCPGPRPRLPLFANARAGCWYTPPAVCGAATSVASFKSADGHCGTWAVSLRRPNVHFFRAALAARGAVLFDATRAGKTFPDALSRTVPLWCATLSLLAGLIACPAQTPCGGACSLCVQQALHLAPVVPPSERAQIEALVPRWLAEWAPARARVRAIARDAGALLPLRAVWTAPGRPTWPDGVPDAETLRFVPIVCVSVSAPTPARVRRDTPGRAVAECVAGVSFPRRDAGYCFVQGAGDDEESWSQGLDAATFWRCRETILSCEDDAGVESVVKSIVHGRIAPEQMANSGRREELGCTGLVVEQVSDSCVHAVARENVGRFAVVIVLGARAPEEEASVGKIAGRVHYFPLENRRGKKDLKHGLGRAFGEVLTLLRAGCASDAGRACVLGAGRHGGDWAAGATVAWVAWHCEQRGESYCVVPKARAFVSKEEVQEAMLGVLGERCDLAMSRATLLQINRFFQSPCPASRVPAG